MKVGRIVFGAIGLLVGIATVSGSLSILTADRDADDFFLSTEQVLARPSLAVVSENVDVLTGAPGWIAGWLTDPVDVRLVGISDVGDEIFLGIAETSALESYLAGATYDEVTSLDFDGDDIRYVSHDGSAVLASPDLANFWAVSVEGAGEQTLDWSLEEGNWSAVVMNADASSGVNATLVFGAKISNFVLLAWIGLAFGVLSVLVAGYSIYRGTRRRAEVETTRAVVDLRGEAQPSEIAGPKDMSAART
jgi:hypothetical protein